MITLLSGVVGSTAYGLATGSSDVDRLSVVAWPTDAWWGIAAPTDEGWYGAAARRESVQSTGPDSTTHEVGKFLRLVVRGNPSATELLWLPAYDVLHPFGAELLEMRDLLVGRQAVRRAYGGYAVDQARKLSSGRAHGGAGGFGDVPVSRTEKHARHVGRLVLQARVLLETGVLPIDVSAHREELFALGRLAVSDPEEFHTVFLGLMEDLDRAADCSALPDWPDRAAAERYLYRVRPALLPGSPLLDGGGGG